MRRRVPAAAMRGGGLGLPDRIQHKDFGAVAAAWGLLEDLGVIQVIDEVAGARRADAGASTGSYLALAALNRVVAPCSKLGFAGWWVKTAAPRFAKVPPAVLDHRRFWDAMHAVTVEDLAEISRRIALAIVASFRLDCSSIVPRSQFRDSCYRDEVLGPRADRLDGRATPTIETSRPSRHSAPPSTIKMAHGRGVQPALSP